jgi:hypothetical protein
MGGEEREGRGGGHLSASDIRGGERGGGGGGPSVQATEQE